MNPYYVSLAQLFFLIINLKMIYDDYNGSSRMKNLQVAMKGVGSRKLTETECRVNIPDDYLHWPHDLDMKKYKHKYQCLRYEIDKQSDNYVVSMTTIPPRFDYINEIKFENPRISSVVVNIPKVYKYFNYKEIPKATRKVINLVDIDYGPGTKIIGLCNKINSLPKVIIYLDDDIEYNNEKLNKLADSVRPGYIVGGNGGFYTDSDNPYFSFITYTYLMLEFKMDSCFIKSESMMGFSAVGMHRSDLKRICESPLVMRYLSNPACYFIDDDWLGRLYHENGLIMVANSELIASEGVERSESDNWSNRLLYHKSRSNCFSYPGYGTSTKLNIQTFLNTKDKHLHDVSEYKNIKSLVRTNHLDFVTKFGHDYKLNIKTTLEKSHWSKIEIALDFQKSCDGHEILFYTDFDFLFINNVVPKFRDGSSIIMNFGCSYDKNMMMVGNFFMKCDPSLVSFLGEWLKATRLASKLNIFNDDQIAFNMIRESLGHKLQVEDFFRYDTCDYKRDALIGIHFPGGNKLDRMTKLLSDIKVIS